MALVGVIVTAIDQLTKSAIAAELGELGAPRRQEVIGDHVAFEYVENTGAAFGLLAGQTWLLSALSVVVVLSFVVTLRRRIAESLPWAVAFSFVLAGALGNLIDRVRLGYVIDFIAIGIWPRFNVADSAITVGIIWLAFLALREPTEDESITATDLESPNEKDSA